MSYHHPLPGSPARRLGRLACAVALASSAATSHAALEEIVVTAQKRAESLQEVPIAVSAFSADSMQDMGITTTQDIQLATPSLVFASQTVLGQPYLRGVGTRFTLNGLDPSVAVYIGERYVPRGSGNQLQLGIDVERVEVLKGPQGILYGRNATGGAIRVIKRDVSDEFEAMVRATAGNYDHRQVAAMVNLPVNDVFGVRLSGQLLERDGWQDNLAADLPGAHDEINDRDVALASARFRWDVTDTTTANLTVDYASQDDTSGQDGSGLGPAELNVGVANLGGIFSTGRKDAATDTQQKNDGEQIGVELDIDVAFENFDFTSVTTYADWEYLWTSDGDGSSASFFTPATSDDQSETFSQEFRLTSATAGAFDWTVGAFYYEDEHETEFLFRSVILPNLSQGDQTTETTAWALFGHSTWHLAQNWALTGGVRYSYEERDVSIVETTTPGFDTLGAAGLPFEADDDWTEVTPMVTLEYQWPEAMAYLTLSRGFKSGGYNYPATTTPEGLDPEILDMVEIGVKGDYLDSRLRLNAAVFYYDYQDLQVQRAAGDTGLTRTENAADAEVLGFELDGTLVLSDAFTLRGGLSLLDTEYEEWEATEKVFRATLGQTTPTGAPAPGMTDVPFDASGEPMLRASDYSYFVTASYDLHLGHGRVPASLTWSYKDDYAFDFTTDPIASEFLTQDGYGLLSARVGYVTNDERWSLHFWGRNLTDEKYFDETAGNAAGLRGYWANPRMYGVDLQFRM